MFHLLPVRRIITGFAIVTVVLLVSLVPLIDPTAASRGILRYVTLAVGFLDIALLIVSVHLWRWFWHHLPPLSEAIFPDINGIWEGKIVFYDEYENERELAARARINQDLWRINIDLSSSTSKSHTLVAYPRIEAGNHLLYYMYHNVPKNPEYPEYKGSSVLTVKLVANTMELNGHYYTVRGTKGRIELKRLSLNSRGDYELY